VDRWVCALEWSEHLLSWIWVWRLHTRRFCMGVIRGSAITESYTC